MLTAGVLATARGQGVVQYALHGREASQAEGGNDIVKNLWWRVKTLVTRRFEWKDLDSGEVEVTYEDWGTTWSLVGIHSYKWWWVRKYGKLPCGCTRNPLTRRMVLHRWRCERHGVTL